MISMTDFATLTRDLFDFFGKNKSPRNSRISIWHDAINKFRESDVRSAFEWMEKSLDNIPNNFPRAISNAIFQSSKGQDEDKNTEYKQHGYGYCEDCNGTGIFKMRICSKNGLWFEPIQYCSQCDNWKSWTNSPGTRISKSELEAINIPFMPYNKVLKAEMEI